ncbi:MAG: TIM barrel protein [Candidatus Methanofastidiosia archaeon]
MKPILAINNSPYYYFNPFMLNSIGMTLPCTERIIKNLIKKILWLSNQFDDIFIPGIQLGVESDFALRSPSLIKSMRCLGEDHGIEFIVHVPDLIVPGKQCLKGLRQHATSYVLGTRNITKERFSMEVLRRADAAYSLGAKTMVIHLPSGVSEMPQDTLSYFSPNISDSLKEKCIKFAIENCNNEPNPFYGNVHNINLLLKNLGDPYVFCFDYGHYIVGRKNIPKDELISAAKLAMVHHVHINDGSSDMHLFMGERPQHTNHEALLEMEKLYMDSVLRNVDTNGKIFVFERNRPYSENQLLAATQMLLSALSL